MTSGCDTYKLYCSENPYDFDKLVTSKKIPAVLSQNIEVSDDDHFTQSPRFCNENDAFFPSLLFSQSDSCDQEVPDYEDHISIEDRFIIGSPVLTENTDTTDVASVYVNDSADSSFTEFRLPDGLDSSLPDEDNSSISDSLVPIWSDSVHRNNTSVPQVPEVAVSHTVDAYETTSSQANSEGDSRELNSCSDDQLVPNVFIEE